MSKVSVPGLKASIGQKSFDALVPGRYRFLVQAASIGEPKNSSPTDVWKYTMQVLKGPDQKDGAPAKGRKYWENVYIMRSEHPDYREDQMGVDTLKSLCLAFGVQPGNNDTLDIEALIGLEGEADITQRAVKNEETGETKIYNSAKWIQQ